MFCCEFELKIKPINLDVWSEREVVINIKVASSSNNNNNKPISNLRTKCKAQNHKQKINIEEKQTHQEMFTQFDPTMTYFRGECSLHFTVNELFTKRYKNVTKIYLQQALEEQKPNFHPFHNLFL
jgi:hypothetical protein